MRAVSVMIKPSSSECNLCCKYCFYNSLSSMRSDFSHGRMSSETVENIINCAYEYSEGGTVFFVFQGGEPLISGIGFFKSFFQRAGELLTGSQKVFFSVQTNGTLIDDDFGDLFRKYKVLVGLSLDGDKENNSYRTRKDGSDAFKDIIKASSILKNHKVEFNVLSVVTKKSAVNIIDIHNYFKNKGFTHLQFIPCLKPLDGGEYDTDLYMNGDDYYQFLTKLFGEYYKDIMRGNYVSVRSLDNYVLLSSGRPAEQCSMNGCCSEQFVIEGDGSIYPCDFYCIDEYCLGNINEIGFSDASASDNMKKFMSGASVITENCKKCPYVRLCRGTGCRRYKSDGDMCEAYKRFFRENANGIKLLANRMLGGRI